MRRMAAHGHLRTRLGAAALTILVAILLFITFFQFRFTNLLEERSQNV